MDHAYREIARAHLDERLAGVDPEGLVPPSDGWIRATRMALGMSVAELARRLSVTPRAVRGYEESEQAGTIQMRTLRTVGEALGVRLAYGLFPPESLEQLVHAQAERRAHVELDSVNHTMALEGQRPHTQRDRDLILDRVEELRRSTRLWTDAG